MADVLIVDDEAKIRRILTLLLRERGHRVVEAGSGEVALDVFDAERPDLVLLDLKMPGIDGLETLRILKERESELTVIIMTAFGSIDSAVEAMRRGAFDYVTKPFDNDALLLIVDRALAVRGLASEVAVLREDLSSRHGFSEIIGVSPPMQRVFRTLAKVARVDATVLVTGESGTGKELIARAVHRRSPRAAGAFVAVNCSAIPQTLVEAEFFGHEKGAFTDARNVRTGKFEQADGGTLFLDETADLAIEAQAKLLRALQERKITRLGAQTARPVDVRVVAATNKNLEAEVAAGRFREDLYWRLNVVHVELPPLRERREDLPLLIDHFLSHVNREFGLSVRAIASDTRELLCAYDWPGNIRELENTLCRSMILCEGEVLTTADLPDRLRGAELGAAPAAPDLDGMTLTEAVNETMERLEKRMILSRLASHHGSRTLTAKSLGVSRKTLFNKMRLYGLTDEDLDESEDPS